MRLVSWNLERRQAAYEHLWSELRPDIALVQEIAAEEIRLRNGVGRNAEGRRFGSAVLARQGLQLREVGEVKPSGMQAPVPVQRSWPGALAVAELEVERGPRRIALVSLHALFEAGWAFRSAHQLVGDLIYLFADRFSPRKHGPAAATVVAGDFNISTQFDPPWDAHARLLFKQLEQYGLVNVLADAAARRGRLARCTCKDDPCLHFETWRRRGQPGTKPRQNDYVLVTEDLATRVDRVEVGPIRHEFSEHAPTTVELAI